MVERSLTYKNLVRQYAQAPQVYGHVIFLALENLWSRIVKSSTVCLSPFITDSRPSKIAQFTHSMRHHDILRFEIPMSNTIFVQVLYGRGDLFDLDCCLFFIQGGIFLKVQKQRSLLHILQ